MGAFSELMREIPTCHCVGSGSDYRRTTHRRTDLRPDSESAKRHHSATAFRFLKFQKLKISPPSTALHPRSNPQLPLRTQWQRFLENHARWNKSEARFRLSGTRPMRNCLSFCDTTKNKKVKKWKKPKFFTKNAGLFLRKCRKFPKKFAGVSRKLITLYGHTLSRCET